ncbi:MAG: hypothetical protein NVS3B26_05380 [Mycobacteriales bacterium]
MTSPQDPFAAPDPSAPPTTGLPGYPSAPYGQPPAGHAAGFGTPPAYGSAPGAWQGPPLAGWGTRAGGYLIDTILSFIVQFVFGRISPGLGSLAGLVVFLVFGYLTGTTGQTPGRKVVGVKILREADGLPLGPGAGIGRGLLHLLDALPLLLGFFWPLWDAKNQTFADKIIKSVAIKV